MRSLRRKVATTSPKSEVSSGANAKRRGFLLALGAGGAGAAALAARSLTGVATNDTATNAASGGEGYRVTDHVRRYYQTAKT